MKNDTSPRQVTLKNSTPNQQQPDFLHEWLAHPGFTEYLGKDSAFKLDVLAALASGGNLAKVAAARGFTRQAAYWHARHARRAFSLGKG